jgi:hypothetical protein
MRGRSGADVFGVTSRTSRVVCQTASLAMRFSQFGRLRFSRRMMVMKAIDGDVLVNDRSDLMGVTC